MLKKMCYHGIFFTSIPMAKKLFKNGLTIICTLRHNKLEIYDSFLEDRRKEIYSS